MFQLGIKQITTYRPESQSALVVIVSPDFEEHTAFLFARGLSSTLILPRFLLRQAILLKPKGYIFV